MQQTLVLIKPDAMKRHLTGYVLDKLAQDPGIRIIGAKAVKVTEELARKHYCKLKNEPFFPRLIEYIQGKMHYVQYLLAFVYEGKDAIAAVRKIAGATNPEEAAPTSIRGSIGRITSDGIFENILHASSCTEDAEFEVKLWFKPSELINTIYKTSSEVATSKELVWE